MQRTNDLRLQLLRHEQISDRDQREGDFELCRTIAADTINAIHDFYVSDRYSAALRYLCITYLSGAVMALTNYMEARDTDAGIMNGASTNAIDNPSHSTDELLRKTYQVVADCAPGFEAARTALRALEPFIKNMMMPRPEHADDTSSRHSDGRSLTLLQGVDLGDTEER